MCRDCNRGLLRNVASGLPSPVLDDEASESAEIDRFVPDDGTLYSLHESLYYGLNCDLLNSG